MRRPQAELLGGRRLRGRERGRGGHGDRDCKGNGPDVQLDPPVLSLTETARGFLPLTGYVAMMTAHGGNAARPCTPLLGVIEMPLHGGSGCGSVAKQDCIQDGTV